MHRLNRTGGWDSAVRGYESAAAENDEHRSRVSAKPGQEWSARCVLGVWVSVFCRERHRRSFEVVICGWRACVCVPRWRCRAHILIPMRRGPEARDAREVPFVYPCPPNLDSRAIQSSTGTA